MCQCWPVPHHGLVFRRVAACAKHPTGSYCLACIWHCPAVLIVYVQPVPLDARMSTDMVVSVFYCDRQRSSYNFCGPHRGPMPFIPTHHGCGCDGFGLAPRRLHREAWLGGACGCDLEIVAAGSGSCGSNHECVPVVRGRLAGGASFGVASAIGSTLTDWPAICGSTWLQRVIVPCSRHQYFCSLHDWRGSH